MIFAFDDLELDTDAFELRRAGVVVPLEPQTFDVLRVLLERRERVVSKEEILDTVWGTRFVSESALTTRIKQARRAIGDDGRSQRLIRTAVGRGYRFVGQLVDTSVVGANTDGAVGDHIGSLLERGAELERLGAALSRTRTGRGSVALVSGEAGIGKTSLVRAFVESSGVDRAFVGGCDDLESPRALGPLRDLARVPGSPFGPAFEGGGDPDSVLAATLDILADGPVVLVIEDVHWADDATLEMLRMVCRRLDRLPAMVVITYRDDALGTDHPLRRLLGALGGDGVIRLTPAPLSAGAVADLAGGSGPVAEEIFDATRGNPFFVTEVLASPGDPVPATVRDAVLSRLFRLSSAGRDVVELVSVVPSRAERWLVDEHESGGLAEAEVAGVLRVDVDHVWFRHELARRAVEDSLPRAEHQRLNRVVLDRLSAHGDVDDSRLVHHARHAGEVDRMLDHAERAASNALRLRAYRQTVDFVDLLLAHPDRGGAFHRRPELLTERAYALYSLNRLEEAARSAREAVTLAKGMGVQYIDALLVLSRSAYWVDGPAAAADCVSRAIDALDGSGDDARLSAAYADLARAYSNLCTVGIVAEPDDRVVVAAQRALELAGSLGRTDLQSHSLQYLGSGRLALGDERGYADLDSAVVLAEVDPRDELPVRTCVNVAGSLFRTGRLAEAERAVDLGLRRSEGGDFVSGRYRLELTRAGVMLADGRWDAAIDLLTDLVGRPGEQGIMRPLAMTILARTLARRGEPSEAVAALAPAVAGAMGSNDVHLVAPVAAAAAELAWLGAGDLTDVVEHGLVVGRAAHHGTGEAEVVAYLRRSGRPEHVEGTPPGPWASTLAGDHRRAASDWAVLGDRYEAAVESALIGEAEATTSAFEELKRLGAVATIAALSANSQ